MKKILLFVSALAGVLFAGSCQREELAPAWENGVVTFEVSIPEVATKAVVDDGSEINKLVYDVYWTDASVETAPDPDQLTLLYKGTKEVVNRATTIQVELMNDKNYVILFWAQRGNTWGVETDGTLLKDGVNFPDTFAANAENIEAFAGVSFLSSNNLSAKKSITLKRPFAQINLGSKLAENFTIVPTTSSMTVRNAGASFDLINQVPVGKKTVEFTAAGVPGGKIKGDYTYVGMNYIFANGNVEVDYTLNTEAEMTVTNTVSNVPVAVNYRTNIIGKLFTSQADYTVTLEEQWADAGKDMEVITEGLVKNINGDYEISNANGLAYAINNLMKGGGNFYLTAAEYDMTGINVNRLVIEAGKTLNIYGETPVVTRSATTAFAGITIKGLDNIIAEIPDGANVSISGVELVDEGSVLVETNSGNLVVSESTGEGAVIKTGKEPVKANNIDGLAALNAALATGVKTIEIAADIEADEVMLINGSVVINGNDKTFTTSANRAFRLTTTGIEVIFNNLKIVSEAVRVGTTDIRGVSIDNVDNITLTLNNSSHDFTDTSANDWAYAVNVVGGTNHKVTINGGKYEGANVVNVRGDNHTITIDGAVLTSLYQPSSAYYGFCVSLQDAENSIATIKNSTLNSVHAKAFGGTTKNEFVLENNTDNTQVYPFYIENNPYLTLNEAFAAAENNATIYAPFDAEIASSTVPEGKKLTLVLYNKTQKRATQLTGVDKATSSFGLINVNLNADLTITGPGSIKLSATNNRGWNAFSSVVSNQRGTLTVNGDAVIEHLGGTDMAYGIDNLTNGKGTSAIATVDGATVKSVYRAIRQFLNGVEATNELYVKANSRIYGPDNKSIWMQDPSKNANTGKLVVEEGAELYGDVYLTVTDGSTEWPVSASIPASVLKNGSQVLTTNVPAGYSVENVGGVWEVIAWTSVSTADELIAALEENKSVVFANDIKIDPANMSNAYGTTGINVKNGQSIDGNGHTLNIKGAGGTWDSGINTTGGLIKNLTVTGSFRGIFINHNSTHSEKVVLEKVTITGTVYTISCDQGLYQGIEATDCTFNGWTSFAKTAGEAKFVNCRFGEGSGYKYCRPYSNTEFVNCTFCPGYAVDDTQATVTFTDCTWEE